MSNIAIIGAGPAGLMAAQTLAERGCKVAIYDHMPSPGRKFLMAGRGGLNLTHSEPLETFITRYGSSAEWLRASVEQFSPEAMRAWCSKLGVETFVGSSGRVFATGRTAANGMMKWLKRGK